MEAAELKHIDEKLEMLFKLSIQFSTVLQVEVLCLLS